MNLTILFCGAALLSVVASRLLAGTWRWGYLLGGLFFGVYNEFLFEFCWTYDPVLGPFLWRDVPLLVVLGWGAIAMLAMTLSDRMLRYFPHTPRHPGAMLMVLDVFVYAVLGLIEALGMRFAHFWTSNFPVQGWFPFQILGYLGVAIWVSSTGRRLEAIRNRG
jgi:hypothetical protein